MWLDTLSLCKCVVPEKVSSGEGFEQDTVLKYLISKSLEIKAFLKSKASEKFLWKL